MHGPINVWYTCVYSTQCVWCTLCITHTYTDTVHCKSWRLPSPEFQVSIDCWGGGQMWQRKAKLYILDKGRDETWQDQGGQSYIFWINAKISRPRSGQDRFWGEHIVSLHKDTALGRFRWIALLSQQSILESSIWAPLRGVLSHMRVSSIWGDR